MPINKDTHVSASVILEKEVYERIKDLAKENKRSISGQIAFMLEESLKRSEKR